MTANHDDPATLVARLSLKQKVSLLTGRDHWHTVPVPEIGLRSLTFSDGPAGVRGPRWDEREPSLSLPSATVLAASWDEALADAYGAVLAGEARRRDVDVLLGPTANMHRSPLAGRNFEAFSEDPVLTGRMAAALIGGLQRYGVAATIKHYVANDYETERFNASSDVSERALREVYLLPFETAVAEAGTWAVMSAYNSINGVTASESPLLSRPLKEEWGFDGLVVSDWGGVRTLEAARAAQDLTMPGPHGPWGDALTAAVHDGAIPEAEVDDKVRRLLLLAARVGALDGVPHHPPEPPPVEAGARLARQVAAEGTVLLTNRGGLLPLDARRLRRVAVLGHNALRARCQGGGSATVLPERVVSPLEGLRLALPRSHVDFALGAVVQRGVAGLPREQLRHPATSEPGVLVIFRDETGQEIHREHRLSTDLVWFGDDAPVSTAASIDLDFLWVPAATEAVRLGFAARGHGRIEIDGTLLLAGATEQGTQQLGANPLTPPSLSAAVTVEEAVPRRVTARIRPARDGFGQAGLFALRVGVEPDHVDDAALLDDAAATAAEADVAVVVVGTDSDVESEGFDRTTLTLPGAQDDLVRAMARTDTPTVVVINSGAPVLLPWRAEVDAIVVTHFGGQEMGHALADVLLGVREPGGRLPTTWPAEEPPPVLDVTPSAGRLAYREGIHIGHRAWLRSGLTPAFPGGPGPGNPRGGFEGLEVDPPRPDRDGEVRVIAHNTGDRRGKQVLSVYVCRRDSDVDRPVRWLVGYGVVRAAPGSEEQLRIRLSWRALAHWDDGWHVEPGRYTVLVGTSVDNLPLQTELVAE